MEDLKFLLDTSILSEPARPRPDAGVMQQLQAQRLHVATASVVIHELRYGVARLPSGRGRDNLTAYLDGLLDSDLPVLPYDRKAALWHGEARAALAGEGRPPGFADGQIAAVAALHGLTVVTRNVHDFAPFDVRVANWFEA